MFSYILNKTTSSLVSISNFIDSCSSYLKPEKLTDEYWKSDESIQTSDLFTLWGLLGTRDMRKSDLSDEQKIMLYRIQDRTKLSDKEVIKKICRSEYMESFSFDVDIVINMASEVLERASYVPYTISYLTYGLEKVVEFNENIACSMISSVASGVKNSYNYMTSSSSTQEEVDVNNPLELPVITLFEHVV